MITGTHDPATPPSEGRALHAALKKSRYLELDSSHLSAWERADEFAGAVVQHLAEGEKADGSADRHEAGMHVRRSVLGDAHVDRAEAPRRSGYGVPGSDYTLCVGRDLDASGPVPPYAQPADHRADGRARTEATSCVFTCVPLRTTGSRRKRFARSFCIARSIAEFPLRIPRSTLPETPERTPSEVIGEHMARFETQVGIVGAGPAGLMLSHLLHLKGIHSIVLEAKSRPYCEERVRAGVLEHTSVQMLREAGVGERLEREGLRHEGIELGLHGVRHRIPFVELTGKCVTVYGQQEVVKDLIERRLADGGDLRFECGEVSLEGITIGEAAHPCEPGRAQ